MTHRSTLKCTTTQRRPENNGNEGVFHIPQISRTGASPSDHLVLHPGYSFVGGSYLTAEMHSTAPADWADTIVEEENG